MDDPLWRTITISLTWDIYGWENTHTFQIFQPGRKELLILRTRYCITFKIVTVVINNYFWSGLEILKSDHLCSESACFAIVNYLMLGMDRIVYVIKEETAQISSYLDQILWMRSCSPSLSRSACRVHFPQMFSPNYFSFLWRFRGCASGRKMGLFRARRQSQGQDSRLKRKIRP